MPSPKPRRIVPSRSLERFVGRWLVAIPVALAPAWLSAELFRLPAGRVCAAMNQSLQEQVSSSVAQRLQQDCGQAIDQSVNFWLLWCFSFVQVGTSINEL